MTWLTDELCKIGLEVNKAKTKLLTTEYNYFKEGTSAVVCIRNKYYHVLGNHEWHKYLGKYLYFRSFHHYGIEVQHRINVAWAQFYKYRYIFLKRNLSLKKRFRLMNAYVTP